jgi:hypothetical protein
MRHARGKISAAGGRLDDPSLHSVVTDGEGEAMKRKFLRVLAVGGLFGAFMIPAQAAHADCAYGDGSCTSSTEVTAGGHNGGGSGGGKLPFTGGDVLGLAAVGGGLTVGGVALARAGRRRATL